MNFGTVKSLQNQCLRKCEIIFVGLKSHPQHELAKRQMRGFSGMITCYIKGGLAESRAFLSTLKVCSLLSPILLTRLTSGSFTVLHHLIAHKLSMVLLHAAIRTANDHGTPVCYFSGEFVFFCQVFTLAESLGGFESLAEHP